MATAYKFRVTFEDYDEVSRDIEIRSNQTFLDLHRCIQQSIAFHGSKTASFFISNDFWIKGQEISSQPKTDKEGKDTILMVSYPNKMFRGWCSNEGNSKSHILHYHIYTLRDISDLNGGTIPEEVGTLEEYFNFDNLSNSEPSVARIALGSKS